MRSNIFLTISAMALFFGGFIKAENYNSYEEHMTWVLNQTAKVKCPVYNAVTNPRQITVLFTNKAMGNGSPFNTSSRLRGAWQPLPSSNRYVTYVDIRIEPNFFPVAPLSQLSLNIPEGYSSVYTVRCRP